MDRIITCLSEYENHLKNTATDLSDVETSEYARFYRLYEYTDDICVLEDNPLFPGLINYVKTGLLTKEELLDALKYDKSIGQ